MNAPTTSQTQDRVSAARWRSWLWFALLIAAPAWADYGAGRLSGLAGSVGIQTQGDTQTHAAALNEVLAEGDQIATGPDGQAELQLDGLLLELAPDTAVALSQLRSEAITVYVARGAVAAGRYGSGGPDRMILQGDRSVNLLETGGRYRFDHWPEQGLESLTVRLGRASSEADVHSETLYAGQSLQFSGEGISTLGPALPSESFDLTLEDRWVRASGSPLARRLAGGWVGAYDLDDQGQWLEVTSAGPLWVPFFLPPGWSPYRSGHWQWNAVWGWNWVDDLDWAWLPYHYGRWIWWNNRWAWSPSGRVPVFTPAGHCPPGLVAPALPSTYGPGGARPLIAQSTAGAAAPRSVGLNATAGGSGRPRAGSAVAISPPPGAASRVVPPPPTQVIPVPQVPSAPARMPVVGAPSGIRPVPGPLRPPQTAGATDRPVAPNAIRSASEPGQVVSAPGEGRPLPVAPPAPRVLPPEAPAPSHVRPMPAPAFAPLSLPAAPAAPAGARAVPPAVPAGATPNHPTEGHPREGPHEGGHQHGRAGISGAGRPAP